MDSCSEKSCYYNIEKVVDKRVKGHKVFYLIKWEGFSEAENTWEPIENLQSCQHLIHSFERKRGTLVKKSAVIKDFGNPVPEKRVKFGMESYPPERVHSIDKGIQPKGRFAPTLNPKDEKANQAGRIEINLAKKIRPMRHESSEFVPKSKPVERNEPPKMQIPRKKSGGPGQSQAKPAFNHHQKNSKKPMTADLSCYDISSSDEQHKEAELKKSRNVPSKDQARNQSPKPILSPRQQSSKPKVETSGSLPQLGKRTVTRFKEDNYKMYSQIVSSDESSVHGDNDHYKSHKINDQSIIKPYHPQEQIQNHSNQNSKQPHKSSTDQELPVLDESSPEIVPVNQAEEEAQESPEIPSNPTETEADLEKDFERIITTDAIEDNDNEDNENEDCIDSIKEQAIFSEKYKQELAKVSEAEHKIFENLSRFETEITTHWLIEGEMWFGVSLNTEKGWKHIGYFSKEQCKQRIPLQLCNFYERFLKIS